MKRITIKSFEVVGASSSITITIQKWYKEKLAVNQKSFDGPKICSKGLT